MTRIVATIIVFIGLAFPADIQADTSLKDALEAAAKIRANWKLDPVVDETAVQKAGLRKLSGRYITLYTDLAPDRALNELPKIFDAAVPLWCEYFGVEINELDSWHVIGCLIDDFAKFRPTGLVDEVPALRHGFSIRDRLWLREQASDYYRRHLLLHEGVHSFMNYTFGKCGPLWYMEGTAEFLAAHRWKANRLEIGIYPKNKDEVPLFDRVGLIQNAFEKNGGLTIDSIFGLTYLEYRENEAYAWSWTFANICARRPEYRDAFWSLSRELSFPEVTERFREKLGPEKMAALEYDLADFIANIDYGYDFERCAIASKTPGRPLSIAGTKIKVRSDRGWQNIGIKLEAGKTYEIKASGRFRIARKPTDWISEPNGVTIRYHNGHPLGTLLAIIAAEPGDVKSNPIAVGTGIEFESQKTGTLYFRINDHPAELEENEGTIEVSLGLKD